MGRAVIATLAGVIFLRVLGVSLLLPGFAAHGLALGGDTFATGVAFGAYPLALALFMLPLGALSDRIGRRAALAGGLAVSAVGGALAAFAPTVLLLGAARFVQGAGAVNAVALAAAGETGAPDARTRRMALLGAAAGIGFAAGIVLGAWLTPVLGVPGLLLAHAIATVALLVPILRLPLPARDAHVDVREEAPRAGGVLWLGLGALGLNLALTGLLFLSPLLLDDTTTGAPYGLLVTLMVLPGGVGMFLAARLADAGHARAVGLASAALLAVGPLAFLWDAHVALVVAGGIVFFIGHSSLSSLLPSLAGRIAGAAGGRTQGIVSTLQYFGSFLGASVAGAIYPRDALLAALFVAAAAAVALGVAAAANRRETPPRVST